METQIKLLLLFSSMLIVSTAFTQEKTPVDNTRVQKQQTDQQRKKKQVHDEFIREVKKDLKELKEEIAMTNKEAIERDIDQSPEFNDIMNSIKAKEKMLRKQLSALKKETEEKQDMAKNAIKETLNEMQVDYEKLVNEVRGQKISPQKK